MSARTPDEIWEEGLDEGERRLRRTWGSQAAAAFGGGADIFFSVIVVVVVGAGLAAALPTDTAHVLAALTFGVGFVFITLGRAELFTENFLLPVGAVFSGRARLRSLLTMWALTLLFNLAALALFAALFAVDGVLPPEALDEAGRLADKLGDRDVAAAFISALAAGTIMTLFTWVVSAAESPSARVIASLIIGFVLAAPSLNHAVVGFGEIAFGFFAGTAESTYGDLARNTAIAVAGNIVGGTGFVFSLRLAQVRGEADSDSGAYRPSDGDAA